MKFIGASLVLASTARASQYPVYSPGAGSVGTCCPLCLAKDIKVPEDRSWAKGMSGGIGMNNNADPVLCRDVVCPKPDCPEFDQFFDGRSCTKCPTSKMTTPADLAASFKPEPKLPED